MKGVAWLGIAMVALAVAGLLLTFSPKSVQSILGSEITVTYPANGTWSTNFTNLTVYFQYTNVTETSANCSFWLNNNTKDGGGGTSHLAYRNTSVKHNTNTTFWLNFTPQNESWNYFHIECGNSTYGNTGNFTYYIDSVAPNQTIYLNGFSNSTNFSNSSLSFNVTPSDHPNVTAKIELINATGSTVLNTTYANNNTNGTLRYNFPDGTHVFYFNMTDNASRVNMSGNYTVMVDTVAPALSYINGGGNGTPINNTYQAMDFITVNATATDAVNVSFFIIEFNGTNYTMNVSNTTINATSNSNCVKANNTGYHCWRNFTSLPNAQYNFTSWANDSAGNMGRASTYTYATIDNTTPHVSTIIITNTSNATDMWLNISFNFTDSNPSECNIIVEGQTANVTINATRTGSGTNWNCTATVYDENVSGDGHFRLWFNATDVANQSNTLNASPNWTKNTLIGGQWNILSAHLNTSIVSFANLSTNITQIALWENQLKVFTSWVRGLSNNETAVINDSDAFLAYANTTSVLLRMWNHSAGYTDAGVNRTVWTGWNMFGYFNNSGINLSSIANQTTVNTTVYGVVENQRIQYATWLNASNAGAIYVSHRKDFTLNAGTVVEKGFGVWVNLNGSNTSVNSTLVVARALGTE